MLWLGQAVDVAMLFYASLLPFSDNEAIHVRGDVYCIEYKYRYNKHKLYFPIRERKREVGTEVYLRSGDLFVLLEQQRNVPYLVTPNDFGEETRITILNAEGDERVIQGNNTID